MKPGARTKWLLPWGAVCLLVWAAVGYAQMSERRSGSGNASRTAYQGVVAPAAPAAPVPEQRLRYKYQYYPDANVYYEPSREVFFYMNEGEWIKSPTLPRALRNRLGDFVIVELASDDPTRYHADVLRRYPGPEAPPPAAGAEGPAPVLAQPAAEAPEPAPAGRPALTFRYNYYPEAQVYFDPARGMYFYFDQQRWIKSDSLPQQFEGRLGDYVMVEMATATPYDYDAQVRKFTRERPPAAASEPAGPPPWRPRGGEAVYHYDYYPDAFVFYDRDRRTYFYRPDGQWLEVTALPKYITQNIGHPVALEMNTAQPYVYEQEVMRRYPHPGVGVNVSRPIYRVWEETIEW
jgi:hypothetical protein